MGKQRQEQGKWTSRDSNRGNGQAETGTGKMDKQRQEQGKWSGQAETGIRKMEWTSKDRDRGNGPDF